MHSQQMFNECIARTWQVVAPLTTIPTVTERICRQRSDHEPLSTFSTNLPAANAEKEANDIALLLLGKLLEVLKGAHFACAISQLAPGRQ